MTFSALDSELLGPLFASDAMRAVFSDRRAGRGDASRRGRPWRAPRRGFDWFRRNSPRQSTRMAAGDLDLAALGREIALAGVPAIPFVKAVQARLPKEAASRISIVARPPRTLSTRRSCCRCARRSALIADDLAAIIAALARLAKKYRADALCRAHLRSARGADHVRIQGGRLAVRNCRCGGGALLRCARASLPPRSADRSARSPGSARPARPCSTAFADALGLAAPVVTWHTLRGRMAETGAWLAMLIGTLAKMAADVAQLASTEVGEVAEPHVHGRGGSSAMPHKRNPVSSIVILAAHAAAKGHVVTLLDAMAAAGQRPVGIWHAEWHALPALFGLASGALREARSLAEGLVVDTRAHARQSRSHPRPDLRRRGLGAARAEARPGRGARASSSGPPMKSAAPAGRFRPFSPQSHALAEELRRDVAAAFDLASGDRRRRRVCRSGHRRRQAHRQDTDEGESAEHAARQSQRRRTSTTS